MCGLIFHNTAHQRVRQWVKKKSKKKKTESNQKWVRKNKKIETKRQKETKSDRDRGRESARDTREEKIVPCVAIPRSRVGEKKAYLIRSHDTAVRRARWVVWRTFEEKVEKSTLVWCLARPSDENVKLQRKDGCCQQLDLPQMP